MSNVKDLRSKTADELNTTLIEKQREYVEAKRANAAGELANPRQINNLRREIARIKTVIGETASTKENA